MTSIFEPDEHLISLSSAALNQMIDDRGATVAGITGASGARALSTGNRAFMGMDRILLTPGSSFPLHTHEGDHLLYVLDGSGAVHIDGKDYKLAAGDSIFVPAAYPHGLRGPAAGSSLDIVAFSIPHHPVDSATRMKVV
jgi:quercetin dioxygenase-like cupin family protein